jgi:hypothetical protein
MSNPSPHDFLCDLVRTSTLDQLIEPGFNRHTPRFVAYADGDTYAGSGDDLRRLLAEVKDAGEDLAIWTTEGT